MLEKNIVVDQITITEDGDIMCRERTDIIEDGVRISFSYHRRVFHPGMVIEGPQVVHDVAQLVHTPAAVQAFRDKMARRGRNA